VKFALIVEGSTRFTPFGVMKTIGGSSPSSARRILSIILVFALSSVPLAAQTLFTISNQVVVPITNYDAAACTGTGHDDAPAFNAAIAANTPNWWAAGTTYASGTVVMSGDGFLYASTINGNIGNNPAFGGNSGDWTQSGAPPNVIVTGAPIGATCNFSTTGALFYPCGNPNTGTHQTVPNVTFFFPGVTIIGTSAAELGCLAFTPATGSGFGNGKLVQTSYAGQTCILTVTPSDASAFNPGDWTEINGINLQAGGYPPNPAFFQYLHVLSSNSGTGQICFTEPLKHKYESTWPTYPAAGQISIGPATLFPMAPGWGQTISWQGTAANPLTIVGRGMTEQNLNSSLINVVGVDPTGITPQYEPFFPTASKNVLWQNVTYPSAALSNTSPFVYTEVDKDIENLDFEGGALGDVTMPSMSVNVSVNVRNPTLSTSFIKIIGTPYTFYGNNVTVAANGSVTAQLNIGADFGADRSFYCNACSFPTPTVTGSVVQLTGSGHATFTYASGVFTFPNADGPQDWAVPGANYFLGGSLGFGVFAAEDAAFQITDITQDATNTYIATTLTSPSLPTLPSSAALYLFPHQAPNLTCISCTGSPEALEWSLAPPGNPAYSYVNRTYSCANWPPPKYLVWGGLIQSTYDVTVADTTQTTLTAHSEDVPVVKSNGAAITYSPLINLKATGLRTVTPSGVTGLQSGDSITTPGADWFSSGFDQPAIVTGTNPSSDTPCLSINVTEQTNQQVAPF
jgi:hypothetical protein